jgi:hypothetical protein
VILVPLDGSKTAESALPYARTLAERLDADVELLEVIDVGEISGNVSTATAALLNDVRRSGRPDQCLTHALASGAGEGGAGIIIDIAAANKRNADHHGEPRAIRHSVNSDSPQLAVGSSRSSKSIRALLARKMFRDNESLDFRGSFIDSQSPDVAVETFENIANDNTASTVNL